MDILGVKYDNILKQNFTVSQKRLFFRIFCISVKLKFFLKMGHFFIFVFSIQLTASIQYKFLPMTGFAPWTSGIGSDRSTNWATTTAQEK